MTGLGAAWGVLALAAAVMAAYPPDGGDGAHHPYPSGSGGYGGGSASGRGYGGSGGYFPAFYPAPIQQKEEKLNKVDKLFARLAALNSHLHILTEAVSAARARVPVLKRLETHLVIKAARLKEINSEQYEELDTLRDLLDEAEMTLNEAESQKNQTEPLNRANADNLLAEGIRLDMAFADNTEQQGALADIEEQIPILKKRLISYAESSYQCAHDLVNRLKDKQNNLKQVMLKHQCETGTIKIHRDDHRATALFQTDFGKEVPNVLWGIAGYTFDLKARGLPYSPQPYYGGYGGGYGGSYGGGYSSGGGYGYPEPNSLGVLVQATPAPDGITFQVINMGFGDSDLVSVKLNYQACNFRASNVF